MSRLKQELCVINVNVEDRVNDQDEDEDLKLLKQLVLTNPSGLTKEIDIENATRKYFIKIFDKLRVVSDNLYVNVENKCGGSVLLYVVPQNKIQTIIKQLHDSIFSGHLEFPKTLERVKTRFFWLQLRQDVLNYDHKPVKN
jgi:hypothetical protein